MANKGLKSIAENTPNFSNQALENAINAIKAIDTDHGYLFIQSQFGMDTAIRDNTVGRINSRAPCISLANDRVESNAFFTLCFCSSYFQPIL